MTAPRRELRKKPAQKRQERQEAAAQAQAAVAPVKGRTPGQKQYLESLRHNDTTIATGPEGTGKTFIASSYAAELFMAGKIKQIILCRPAVEAGDEKIGFLPGDMKKKMAPWTEPVVRVLQRKLGAGRVAEMIASDTIRVVPFGYMRGHTFDDAFVLLDEAQNTTTKQMRLFLTRFGENVRAAISGDVRQCDIREGSGLAAAVAIARRAGDETPIGLIELTKEDIVRSEQCRFWAEGFDALESGAI